MKPIIIFQGQIFETEFNYERLKSIKGIGEAKACELLASIELGKRINRELVSLNNVVLNKTSLVFDYYKDRLSNLNQEYFYCVYLLFHRLKSCF